MVCRTSFDEATSHSIPVRYLPAATIINPSMKPASLTTGATNWTVGSRVDQPEPQRSSTCRRAIAMTP